MVGVTDRLRHTKCTANIGCLHFELLMDRYRLARDVLPTTRLRVSSNEICVLLWSRMPTRMAGAHRLWIEDPSRIVGVLLDEV